MVREYRYISGDSHLEIPPYWTERVPVQYRDWSPQLVRLEDGTDAWFVNGKQVGEANAFDLYGGKGRDVWRPIGQTYDTTPGTGQPDQRVREQDIDGIDAEVLFPAQVAGPNMWRRIENPDAYRAVVRAYNDWLALDYCAYAPDRLMGVGILPASGVDDAIDEMEHCAKLGLKIVQLTTFPSAAGYPTPEDDKFWQASLDLQMPVSVHVELRREGPYFRYPIEPPRLKPRLDQPTGGVVGQTARFARAGGLNAVQWTLDHLFDRFPSLHIYLAENSIGWVPFFLKMADIRYGRHRWWSEADLGWKPLDKMPSEIIREHFYWGFQEDPIGVELRRHIGVERVCWGTDFPHQESEWPHSMGVAERNFAGVPEDERVKMVAGNIIRFLGLKDAVAVPAPLPAASMASD
jgi:predicted TIM-barrel fold metal-dependent hydrolase